MRKNCPQSSFKLEKFASTWKAMRKELAQNRIRDLARFEVDESTIRKYAAWACSNAAPRHIQQFPTVAALNSITDFKVTDDVEALNSLEDKYNENGSSELDAYEDHSQVSSRDMYFYLGFFLFGVVLGGVGVQYYNFRAGEVKFASNKVIRRPEL
ncbi:unnamed protein product [Bathycoccus prasinos]